MTYETMAEFHDLFMIEQWRRLAPALVDAFSHLGPQDTVVDPGAGTGLGATTVASVTAAQIWAVEPSVAMRSVLLHHVAASPDLSARVSVVAGSVPDNLDELPPLVHGVLAMHMMGHLSTGARSAWWRWLATSLASGGVALVTHQPAYADVTDAGDPVAECRIGAHTYRVTYLADPPGETFRSRYDVLDDTRVIRTVEVAGHWRTITIDDLRSEAAEHQLVCQDSVVYGVGVIKR